MTASWVLVITVLVAALGGVAYVIGRLITLRAGLLKASEDAANVDTSDLACRRPGRRCCTSPRSGVGRARRSAGWWTRCAKSCRGGTAHVEIDMDANPEAARRLSVLSLPTTIVFDRDGDRATAPTACRRPLTCGRRWNRCWLDHPVDW